MSEANLETMRRQYEVQAREGGLVPDLFAQDAEWMAAREDPDAATHYGVDGIRAYLDQWFGAFQATEFRVEEMIDAGDKVFSWIVFSGRGPSSGVPVELQQAQVATFRDGKIARIEEYYDRSEGLEAAGLSE
jgi:ketosteroid isomerase-like protein